MEFYNGSENIPFQICEDELGEVIHISEECPGVYYMATQNNTHLCCREFYVVTRSAIPTIISREALSYGKKSGEIYLFEHEVENSGWAIISFEIVRYSVKHGLSLKYHDTLYCEAVYAAEHYPEYFGGILPPRNTPYGITTRAKKMAEGLYFIDTTKCQWLLAVAYPIWECTFSDMVKQMGQTCQSDIDTGYPEARYLFFKRDRCASAIYELLQSEYLSALLPYIHSKEAVETQIYLQCPMYAILNNYSEMTGCGKADASRNFWAMLGYPVEDDTEDAKIKRRESCIHFWPDMVNEDLLLLPE